MLRQNTLTEKKKSYKKHFILKGRTQIKFIYVNKCVAWFWTTYVTFANNELTEQQ